MNLSELVSLLIIVGMLMWFVFKYIPMNRDIRKVLTIVLAVTIVFSIATYFDVFSLLEGFHSGG